MLRSSPATQIRLQSQIRLQTQVCLLACNSKFACSPKSACRPKSACAPELACKPSSPASSPADPSPPAVPNSPADPVRLQARLQTQAADSPAHCQLPTWSMGTVTSMVKSHKSRERAQYSRPVRWPSTVRMSGQAPKQPAPS